MEKYGVRWSSQEQHDRCLATAIIYMACAITLTCLWGLS